MQFLADLSRQGRGAGPSLSHLTYDIVRGKFISVKRPDILILEGLGVLHRHGCTEAPGLRGDFFDFSIYLTRMSG